MTLCNLMIVVIQQTKYLLDKMIAAQEADFKTFSARGDLGRLIIKRKVIQPCIQY